MEPKPKFVTITGRPLSGKSLVIKRLLEARPDMEIFKGQSYTTRPPREGDVPGEYAHVSDEEFDHIQHEGDFIWTFPHGHYRLGTKMDDIVVAMKSEKVSVMTLVPEAVAKIISFAGRDKVIPFFIESSVSDSIARLSAHRSEGERTLARFHSTMMWKMEMFELGLEPVLIGNPNEAVPGEQALRRILEVLAEKGL